MLFTEFQFIFCFLPLVLAVHALLPRVEQRLWFLFCMSLIFYALWDWKYLPLLAGSIVCSWVAGNKINFSTNETHRKYLTLATVIISLLPLIYFKYSLFIAKTFDFNFGWKGILPLGISFYTFQQITYIVNIYKRRFPPSKRFIDYGFVVTFFPHLIAGPILFFKDISWQIGVKVNRNAMFVEGLAYFIIGLSKKIFIADNIAVIVNPIFQEAVTEVPNFSEALAGTLGYTLQLYFDFSGYSDMAIGLGLLLGYRLPINFNSPYKAGSLIEFWQRWHITLSNFLRDYVYIPLGGNRYLENEKWKWYRNLTLTMLIGGLWHGANWTFIAWGGLHGMGLVANHLSRQFLPKRKWINLLGYPCTFLFVALGWVLFRAEDFSTATNIYLGLLDPSISPSWENNYLWILLGLALIFSANSHQIVGRLPAKLVTSGSYFRIFFERRIIIYILLAQLIWSPLIIEFYTHDWDKKFYKQLSIRHETDQINNDIGDYRSNLLINQIFTGDEKKIIFVGSSYTKFMGAYDFTLEGKEFKTGTLGMGGNYIFVPLRTATQILDTPNLHILVMAVSALNMIEVSHIPKSDFHSDQRKYAGAFPTQCYERVNDLGFDFSIDRFGYCSPKKVGLFDSILVILSPGSPIFKQLHGFLQKINTASEKKHDESYTQHLDFSIDAAHSFFLNFAKRMQHVSEKLAAPDNKNGKDANFKWQERGTIKAISPNGDIYKALAQLAVEAQKRNIKFIIYTTPTVSHLNDPSVYPAGYYEEYQIAMQKLANDNGITYYDLSNLLPWRKDIMFDFIHPEAGIRKDIQKYLLYTLYKDGHLN